MRERLLAARVASVGGFDDFDFETPFVAVEGGAVTFPGGVGVQVVPDVMRRTGLLRSCRDAKVTPRFDVVGPENEGESEDRERGEEREARHDENLDEIGSMHLLLPGMAEGRKRIGTSGRAIDVNEPIRSEHVRAVRGG